MHDNNFNFNPKCDEVPQPSFITSSQGRSSMPFSERCPGGPEGLTNGAGNPKTSPLPKFRPFLTALSAGMGKEGYSRYVGLTIRKLRSKRA